MALPVGYDRTPSPGGIFRLHMLGWLLLFSWHIRSQVSRVRWRRNFCAKARRAAPSRWGTYRWPPNFP